MKIGKYEIHIIDSGRFALDGGAMFGIIPKSLWERKNPADEKNRIPLATRNLLLVSDNKKILVDTGMGKKWDEKSKEIYQIEQEKNSLEKSLKNIGYSSDDITDVFLTHLHFDHTGGSTKIENGNTIPAFKNAKYHVGEKNFNWAKNPSDRDKGSYLKDSFIPLAEEGVLNLFKENNFDDEIELIEVNGHTFGQNLLKISDSSKTIFYCGDLFPTTSHIPFPYIMGYDIQPLVTLKEKKEILHRAFDEKWLLIFEHDPYNAAGTVSMTNKGCMIDEKYGSI